MKARSRKQALTDSAPTPRLTDRPSLAALIKTLPNAITMPLIDDLPGTALPEPYRKLLVHDQHMTVTMEAYHGCRVNVRVQQRLQSGKWYVRQIVLVKEGTEEVVQGGIVRIDLDLCSPDVRQAILREDTPLGHILIEHDVMRRIEITQYLRISLDGPWQKWLDSPGQSTTYARLGFIHCDGKPAIELFEIIVPTGK